MAKRIVKTATGQYAEIDDVPWWQDKAVILQIITTIGMIVAAWNAYWAKDNARDAHGAANAASAQSAENGKKVDDLRANAKVLMYAPPPETKGKE